MSVPAAAPAPGWVTSRTGLRLTPEQPQIALALRRNPKRAHLLVSAVLAKHLPVPASVPLGAAAALAGLVRDALHGAPATVIGFAETATALGHGVARVAGPDGGCLPYVHTTRRPVPPELSVLAFDEEHSHAVEQLLAVLDDGLLADPEHVLVLVDDELSTGQTSVNAIRVLQQRWPRQRYLLASLLDVRSPAQQAANLADVAALGATVGAVSLATGAVLLPADLMASAAALIAERDHCPVEVQTVEPGVPITQWELGLTAPLTGAHGWTAADEVALEAAVTALAAALEVTGSVLVLGDEEFMYAGQRLALALGPLTHTSSTTRSPALVVDAPGYPLRTALTFAATDDPDRVAYAYNVAASRAADRGPAPGFDHLVLLLDREPPAHTRELLFTQLAGAATVGVTVVVVVPAATLTVRRTG